MKKTITVELQEATLERLHSITDPRLFNEDTVIGKLLDFFESGQSVMPGTQPERLEFKRGGSLEIGRELYKTFKGQRILGVVECEGIRLLNGQVDWAGKEIESLGNNEVYDDLSSAAKAASRILGGSSESINGWTFWNVKLGNNQWKKVDSLRPPLK
jgi:hypothetical protein